MYIQEIEFLKRELYYAKKHGLKNILFDEDGRLKKGSIFNFPATAIRYIDDDNLILWVTDNMGNYATSSEIKTLIDRLQKSLLRTTEDELAEVTISSLEYQLNKALKKLEIAKPTQKKGFVYLIKGEFGRYKIGASKNPKKRLADLKLASAENHTLISFREFENPFKTEEELHARYKNKRKHSEWFELSDTEVAEVIEFLGGKKCNIL